jgi:beta-glucanase (GH16 family)
MNTHLPGPRVRHQFLSLIIYALFVAVLALIPHQAHADAPVTPEGWTVEFLDDFNGNAGTLPSGSNWRIDLSHGYPNGPLNWGTHEVQSYTADPANVSLDGNGQLLITPHRDAKGEWTSGRIETIRDNFKPPEGGLMRVQARLKLPEVAGNAAQGYWPAFWMLGAPYRENFGWPSVGEFDIMENVNGLDRVWDFLHCGIAPGGPCNEFNGIGATRSCPEDSCQTGFHLYTFEWDRTVSPVQLRWYVDDKVVHSVSQDRLPADTWANMTEHRGYFILLNLAIGGGFPDAFAPGAVRTPSASTEPGKPLTVDYVAVWMKTPPAKSAESNPATPPEAKPSNNAPAAASSTPAPPNISTTVETPTAVPAAKPTDQPPAASSTQTPPAESSTVAKPPAPPEPKPTFEPPPSASSVQAPPAESTSMATPATDQPSAASSTQAPTAASTSTSKPS